MRTKLTKSSAGHRSLRDRVSKPYQLLYCDHAFPGRVKRDADGEKIESSLQDVEGVNGESS